MLQTNLEGPMGQIDAQIKQYLSKNHVFADIFNFYLYNGEEVIKSEDLHELDGTEIAVLYGDMPKPEAVQKYRDILKSHNVADVGMEGNVFTYLILGIEEQSNIHYAMPIRNMLYDALQYAGQVKNTFKQNGVKMDEKIKYRGDEFLSNWRKEDKLRPVITLVVFFGEKEWDGAISIREMIGGENNVLQKYIADYKMNIITPAKIEDSEFSKFKTDIGAVLRGIKHSSDKDVSFLELPEYKEMELEAAHLLKEITNIEIDLDKYTDERGVVNMCYAWENSKKIYREEGKKEERNNIVELMQGLFATGRVDDLKKASSDGAYLNQLLEEFQTQSHKL